MLRMYVSGLMVVGLCVAMPLSAQQLPARGEEYLRNRIGENELAIAGLLTQQQQLQAEIVRLTAELAATKKGDGK